MRNVTVYRHVKLKKESTEHPLDKYFNEVVNRKRKEAEAAAKKAASNAGDQSARALSRNVSAKGDSQDEAAANGNTAATG